MASKAAAGVINISNRMALSQRRNLNGGGNVNGVAEMAKAQSARHQRNKSKHRHRNKAA
jgi:hypothetical protein